MPGVVTTVVVERAVVKKGEAARARSDEDAEHGVRAGGRQGDQAELVQPGQTVDTKELLLVIE